jgi:ArsR family metal-binding transcriptional regulator
VDDDFVKLIEIRAAEMCTADPDRIRIEAVATSPLKEILPFVAAVVPRSSFSEGLGFVTWKDERMTYAVYASGNVTITQLRDREDALEKLEALRRRLNDIWARREGIDVHARKRYVGPLEVYKLLPKTNCRKCGLQTCLAFASGLLSGAGKPKDCPGLGEDGMAALNSLLKEAGIREAI